MTETQTTETNAVPYFPHQAPRHVPLTKRGWFLPVAVGVAVVFGAGAASTTAAVAATVKAGQCRIAFEHAETALNASSNVIDLLGDGLTAAASLNADALDGLGPKLDAESARIGEVTEPFKIARAACEK